MEEQPIVAGLLLEVRTVRGLRYVQVASSSTARYAPSLRSTWVRVLPGEFTRRPTELSIVAALDEEYFVLLGYAETIPIPAQIEVVAFESVPAGHDRPGLVRALASPKDGRVRWRVSEPCNESVLVDGDALSDEQANASLSTLLSTDDLVQVLNADWHPRRAVLTGRVPRKESAEDAPALDWTYDFTVRFPLEAHAIMFASQLRRRIPALHVMIAPRLARHEVTVFGHEGDPRGTEDAIRELANAGKGEIVHSGRRLDGQSCHSTGVGSSSVRERAVTEPHGMTEMFVSGARVFGAAAGRASSVARWCRGPSSTPCDRCVRHRGRGMRRFDHTRDPILCRACSGRW